MPHLSSFWLHVLVVFCPHLVLLQIFVLKMAATTLVDFFAAQVGRSLSPTELAMLCQLTPQGVAKVNADFHRGACVFFCACAGA